MNWKNLKRNTRIWGSKPLCQYGDFKTARGQELTGRLHQTKSEPKLKRGLIEAQEEYFTTYLAKVT